MRPDAPSSPNSQWYFRELLMALMLQEDAQPWELGERLGMSRRTVYSYLSRRYNHQPRYTQQFLLETMLLPETRCRLTQQSPIT